MSTIILYGAFDRHNYGDLLFPMVMQKMLQQQNPAHSIVIAAMIDTDLSNVDALPTVSIQKALKAHPDSVIMLAGGDVIGCDWVSATAYLMSDTGSKIFERYVVRFLPKLSLRYIQSRFGFKAFGPFNFAKQDVGGQHKIIFNSAGATSVSGYTGQDADALAKTLQDADYLSVRDHFSKDNIQQISGLASTVAPDSACMMSVVYSEAEIDGQRSPEVKSLIEGKDKYLVFQISNARAIGREQGFANALTEYARSENCAILFLSIGNAAGHSDYLGLKRIMALMPNDVNMSLYEEGKIFDIMAIIKSAVCYCGTSLHGLITSIAFHVPRIALTPSLRKQINYMNTWDLETMPRGIEPDALVAAIQTATSIPMEDLVSINQKCQSTYQTNFERIVDVIEG